MQTVIIAGGKGTRLGLKNIPKPMVKLNGKPLLEYQIELAKSYGSSEIFIISGFLSEIIKNYFSEDKNLGVKINHIEEPFPLGTAGCLKLLEGKLEERFMVFYGDIVMDFDIDEFIKFDNKYKNSLGTVVVHPNNHPYDSDLVEIDKEYKINNIIPKPHNGYFKNLVNAGVYILSKEIFKYIKENEPQDLGKDIFPKIVKDNGKLYAYNTAEYIKDMGTPDRFKQVEKDILSGKVHRLNKKYKRPCIFLDRDGVINKNMDTKPSVKNFKLLDNVPYAIRKINESDYLAIIVTNQPMIAKGFITFEETENIHKKMESFLGADGAFLNAIYYCPHHPDLGFEGEIKELKKDCECRKPKAGMLYIAAAEFNIDLKNSWIVGDSKIDILAGKNAGCKTASIGINEEADISAVDLLSAIDKILERKKC